MTIKLVSDNTAPPTGRFIHVRRNGHGWLTVEQVSEGAGSMGILANYPPRQKERAVRHALDALKDYPGSQIG